MRARKKQHLRQATRERQPATGGPWLDTRKPLRVVSKIINIELHIRSLRLVVVNIGPGISK